MSRAGAAASRTEIQPTVARASHASNAHATAESSAGSAPDLATVLQRSAGNRAVAGLILQRKGGGGGGTAKGDIGIPGGESSTASDQDAMAPGYVASGSGFTTPDGRTVSEAQAKDESKVINSTGIYLAAYLGRWNAVRSRYSLSEPVLAILSTAAGYTKQFQTGDVVLRLMDATDSGELATITRARYSHSGVIKAEGGRVMVLDSYPRGANPQGPAPDDATILTPFEDFFSDQHGEKVVNGLVLRATGLTAAARADIAKVIDKYDVTHTTFDFDFSADNGATVLYCSELVTGVLREAAAPGVPANEFDATKANVVALINTLQAVIAFQKQTGTDPKQSQQRLATLQGLLATVDASSVKELLSPGSFERDLAMPAVAGMGRDAAITGKFSVTVVSAVVPDGVMDTPDPYVILKGSLTGQTSAKDDTTTPAWGETFTGFDYDDLRSAIFQIRDSDVLWDDDIATVSGDVRPVNPSGQTFSMSVGGTTLKVTSAAEDPQSGAAQGPRDTTPL